MSRRVSLNAIAERSGRVFALPLGRCSKLSFGTGLHASAPGVQQPADVMHRRLAAGDHVLQRSLSTKHGIAVRKLYPFVGKLLAVQDVDSFEYPKKVRDAEHPIDVQNFALWVLLHLVKRPIRDIAQEHPGVLITDFPNLHHLEESGEGRSAEALTLLGRIEVGKRLRRVPSFWVGLNGCHTQPPDKESIYSCCGL